MIRDTHIDDADAVAAIWNPFIRDTTVTFWPSERSTAEVAEIIGQRQRDGHAHVVAQREGEIIGFGTYSQFRGGLGYARSVEHTVYLAAAARGTGLGRALLEHLEDHARAAGRRLMIGGITGSNSGSLRFHDRMGYSEWGRVPAAGWKFGQFHDLVFMGKDLLA
ncbi:GNAT family N-acetyltransferase [Paracoccus tegillarcae]|uniref:GNAT family N-acetyltransferase n=1 Tax=Paracoccus tegillarcae TaxID=1529068 RepID=A0A2K9ES75_9RHOB|nr:GNAT family N-acetyltransferase [Paracoccus tegillarcae]AUH34575.1 GNAT family N-acetyltransferase [Paracoccus tegillarcae]